VSIKDSSSSTSNETDADAAAEEDEAFAPRTRYEAGGSCGFLASSLRASETPTPPRTTRRSWAERRQGRGGSITQRSESMEDRFEKHDERESTVEAKEE
jgi:hypothetical protein